MEEGIWQISEQYLLLSNVPARMTLRTIHPHFLNKCFVNEGMKKIVCDRK